MPDQKRYQQALLSQAAMLEALREKQALDPSNQQVAESLRMLEKTAITLPKYYDDSIPARFKIAHDVLGDQFTEALRRHLLFSHDLTNSDIVIQVLKTLATGKLFYHWIVGPEYLFVHALQYLHEDIESATKRMRNAEELQKLQEQESQVARWRKQFLEKK